MSVLEVLLTLADEGLPEKFQSVTERFFRKYNNDWDTHECALTPNPSFVLVDAGITEMDRDAMKAMRMVNTYLCYREVIQAIQLILAYKEAACGQMY